MNFYEEYIIKLERRIKRIEEDPDPTKLKSNKIRYQIELELTKERLEGWRQGKPFSYGGGRMAGILTRVIGFLSLGEAQFQTTEPQKYLEQARAMGLPVDKSCDMSTMQASLTEGGAVPMEDVGVCNNHCCTPMLLNRLYVANALNTLTYYIDRGFEENEANLKYVTEQFGEFIEFCEKRFPGVIKYDEDKLIEMEAYEDEINRIEEEIRQMAKHKPAPVSGRGGGGRAGGIFHGVGPMDVELARAVRDEIAERVAKGIAAVPGEKLRVLWTGVTNPFFMDPYKVLAKWKIAVPRAGRGTWNFDSWGDRKLTPLEKVAARVISDTRGGSGTAYVDEIIWNARDLQVDGIVNYNMRGCTAALGLKKIIEERAEKELGIPVLQLEGAQWDTSYADEATITAKLDDFAQMLLSQRGLA